MTESAKPFHRSAYGAHILPFAVFMVLLSVPDLLGATGEAFDGETSVYASKQVWLYPLQTLICFGLLIVYRKHYPWQPVRGLGLAVVCGLLGIALWLLPGFMHQQWKPEVPLGEWLGIVDRSAGFNPSVELADNWAALTWFWGWRLLRLVVVVPVMEEVFWRSFLMRFLEDSTQDFDRADFGRSGMTSLLVVTGLFVAAHQPADYFGAICFGLLAYWLTVRTKSLVAVIVMHAVANAGLAAYAAGFGQWGYL